MSSTSRLDRVARQRALAAGLTHPAAQLGISAEMAEGGRQRVDVPDRREQAVDAVRDDVRDAADRRRNDRPARRKRLDRDDRGAFVARRQEQRVEEGEVRADVSLVAGQQRLPGDPELGEPSLHTGAVGTVADEAEPNIEA